MRLTRSFCETITEYKKNISEEIMQKCVFPIHNLSSHGTSPFCTILTVSSRIDNLKSKLPCRLNLDLTHFNIEYSNFHFVKMLHDVNIKYQDSSITVLHLGGMV